MESLADRIIPKLKEAENKKEFDKNFKSELRHLRMWQSDMQRFLKLPDSEYKFKQLNNATSAIYSAYTRMSNLLSNYKPENLPKYHE